MATSTEKTKISIWSKFRSWKPGLDFYGLILTVIASGVLLLWRLSSLTSSLVNTNELATKHQLFLHSPWWKSLNALNGPYYLLLHATYAINRSVFDFRLSSVIIGVLTVAIVYWIVSGWHGYKIGLLSAAIILANFGLIASSREATPLIAQLLLMSAVLLALTQLSQKPNLAGLILLLVVLAGALYVSGGIWLVLAAVLLSYKTIWTIFLSLKRLYKLLIAALPLLLIVPLSYQLIAHYSLSQLKTWLGYGLTGTKAHLFHNFLINFIHIPGNLFIHSESLGTDISLGHLPMLPITFSLLFVLGLYGYATRLTNWRWRTVLILLGIGWLLGGFGAFSALALLPLIAVTAGTGLAFLLKEWYQIFPRNPIARSTGVIIMFAVISLSSIYAIRSYIVAWANSPTTTSSYTKQLK